MRDHRGSDLGLCGKTIGKCISGRLNQVSKVRVFLGSRKVRARRSLAGSNDHVWNGGAVWSHNVIGTHAKGGASCSQESRNASKNGAGSHEVWIGLHHTINSLQGRMPLCWSFHVITVFVE